MSKKLYKLYCKYPIAIRSLTGATLFLTADVAGQQMILKKKDDHDYISTAFAALIGVASGSVLSSWYSYLERKIGPYQCFRPAMNKTILDQFLFAPVFMGLPLHLSDVRTFDQPSEWFKLEDYKDLMLSCYKFTPLLMFLNFRYVSFRNRVMMSQVYGAVWWFAHAIEKENGKEEGGGGKGGGEQKGKDEKKGKEAAKDSGKDSGKGAGKDSGKKPEKETKKA